MASRKPLVLGPGAGKQEIAAGDVLAVPGLALTTPLGITSGGTGSSNGLQGIANLLGTAAGYYVSGFAGNAYVSYAPKASLVFGTGDFTVEFWINPGNTAGFQAIWDTRPTNAGAVTNPAIFVSSGTIILYVSNATLASAPLAAGSWQHIAVVRKAGVTTIYNNGVGSTAATDPTSYINNSTNIFGVSASDPNHAQQPLSGPLSNFRISNAALYSGNFTPPGSALTVGAATALLTFQNATLVDNSVSPVTLSATGAPAPALVSSLTPPNIGTTGVITVAQGGTGASSADKALANLGGAALAGAAFTGPVSVPDINVAGTGNIAGAWTASTPAVSVTSGALTAANCNMRILKVGRTVHINVNIAITNNGTGAGAVTVPLPFTAAVASVIAGRETAVGGKMLQGVVAATGNTLSIQNYDSTYPGGSTYTLVLAGVMEATA